MAPGDALSVIIPTWREGAGLIEALHAARQAVGQAELVVVGADETDAVREAARGLGVHWVDAPRPCRGLQLDVGAQRAGGDRLLFLHADTRLPDGAGRMIHDALDDPCVAGGAFRLRFDRTHPVLDLLARMSAIRLPAAFLGDQGLFCTRAAYRAAGGFHPQPLFEDVDLARRLARVGRLVRLARPVTTSARRFVGRGPLRQLGVNAALYLAFLAGVAPRRLITAYSPSSPEPVR
jgi:rSAM/selenodomain-associated transferase 2